MKNTEVKVGLIQMRCGESLEKNLERALERMTQAVQQGAQILCLQELFNGPYFCQINDSKFFRWAQPVPGPLTDELSKLAKFHSVVLVGSLFERENDQYYNTAFVLDADGSYLGKYRKVHIPDDPRNFYSEKFYFSNGNLGFPVFETRYARIGVQVCWDQWFPEGARSLALKGAQILFYPTAIGWQVNGDEALGAAEHDAWMTVQRGHAISNTVFVAAANRTGRENHLDFWGSSFVADPLGRILKKAPPRQEENLVVSCDLSQIDAVRKDWPFLTCRQEDQY